MKTKLLAMMLLAGGTMFAQPRVSIGVGVGGYGGGFYQSAPPYAYSVPPCPAPYWVNGYCVGGYGYAAPFYGGVRIAPHFSGGFVREGVTRGFAQDRNRGFSQGRNGSGQNRGGGQNHGGGNRR
jgi:hypothetical protein